MNNCLRCVALGIDDYVERFYAKLGYAPWDVYANKRHAANMRTRRRFLERDRQTGRTVHGLIETIAECVARNVPWFGVKEPLYGTAQTLIKQLEVHVTAIPSTRGVSIVYEDHYHG